MKYSVFSSEVHILAVHTDAEFKNDDSLLNVQSDWGMGVLFNLNRLRE